MEEDHSFLFLNNNLINIFFFFFLNLENLNFFKELKFLIDDFLFFILKILEILNFLMELKILIDFFFFGKILKS